MFFMEPEFWVAVAFVVFIGVLVWAGVHKLAWAKLGEAGAKVQAQLDEAARQGQLHPRAGRVAGPSVPTGGGWGPARATEPRRSTAQC